MLYIIIQNKIIIIQSFKLSFVFRECECKVISQLFHNANVTVLLLLLLFCLIKTHQRISCVNFIIVIWL
jgi:hypothetical protein